MRLLFASVLSAALLAAPPAISDAEVRRVHASLLIVDTHNDVPMKTMRGYDIAKPSPKGSTDLARLKAGNVAATFFAAYVPAAEAKKGTSAEYCRRVIGSIRNDIAGKHPGNFVLARTADEILAARKQSKIAALIGIEGGHAIEDSLDNLREFFNLGARYMTLTHSNTNNWADSSGDLTKAGLIASHSSCRALSNHSRNMTDDMIRAMAAKGGVIHINFACTFLNERTRTANPAIQKQLNSKCGSDMDLCRALVEGDKRIPRATLTDVVAHIDHVVKIAGADAVGIGSDFDGVDCAPIGLDDVSKFPNLTRALLEKGYTEAQVRKIYGENTLRVMRAVEKAARPAK
jgi:membrane dipeptidase